MIEKQFNIAIQPDTEESDGPPIDKVLYLSGVRTDLARILKSETGRDLAASLRYHSKEILLVPYPGEDGNAQEWYWGNDPKDNYSMVLRDNQDERPASIKMRRGGRLAR